MPFFYKKFDKQFCIHKSKLKNLTMSAEELSAKVRLHNENLIKIPLPLT